MIHELRNKLLFFKSTLKIMAIIKMLMAVQTVVGSLTCDSYTSLWMH